MKTETLVTTAIKSAPKRRRSLYREYDSWILGGTAVLLIMAAWEGAWQAGWISPLFFTGPSAVWGAFRTTWASGELLDDLVYSGRNFTIGFTLAVISGVVPRIALVPLIIVWFGIGSVPGIVIVFMGAFFPILINTIVGVKTIDDDLLKAARSFCASDRQIFTTVALPGSVPFILTGVRQGVAHNLIKIVVGEMFLGGNGIGFMIAYSGQTFATERIFLGVVIMAGAGIILTSVAEKLQAHFSRWRPER
jgi:NitT/TauT family transport system permease protein